MVQPNVTQLILRGSAVRCLRWTAESAGKSTLLFLHGWRSEGAVWSEVASALVAAGHSCIAIDLPGFGGSETPTQRFDLDAYVDVVTELIAKLQLGSVVVVGHSLGGRIGIKLSLAHPALVSKLVLVNSAGVPPKRRPLVRLFALLVKPLFRPAVMKPLRLAIYRLLGSEDYVATPQLRDTFLAIIAEDLRPVLGSVTVPTLLIWGEQDLVTPKADGELMARTIPGARLIVFEQASHYSFLDQPERFVEEVLQFLR